MPGIEDQPPSADQVSIIRQKFQEYITENGKGTLIISSVLNLALVRWYNKRFNLVVKYSVFVTDNFDALDVQRVLTEDFYVHRWFMHVFDMPGDQIETCTNNMIKALKWRKDENIRGNYNHKNDNLTPLSQNFNFRNHLQVVILIF